MTSLTTNTIPNLYINNDEKGVEAKGNNVRALKGKAKRTMLRRRLDENKRFETDLEQQMNDRVIGQANAVEKIVNQVNMHSAGMSQSGKLVGSFLLMGPTGVGKTKIAETLAEALHGSPDKMLKINCAEFTMEHEVAKLIGAPPGYLGHRETSPLLSQARIDAVASDNSKISIILLDEIEKAAPSFQKFFLNVMDKAKSRTGDNNEVFFHNCLLLMTSNLGAKEMFEYIRPSLGFHGNNVNHETKVNIHKKLDKIAIQAVKKHFSPEFINRVDYVLTCDRLTREETRLIIDLELADLQNNLIGKDTCNFIVYFTDASKEKLLTDGVSEEYGARLLKRVIDRDIRKKICTLINTDQLDYGDAIEIDLDEQGNYAFWLTSRIMYAVSAA